MLTAGLPPEQGMATACPPGAPVTARCWRDLEIRLVSDDGPLTAQKNQEVPMKYARLPLALGVLLFAGCESATGPVASRIVIESGDNQVGEAGAALPLLLRVRVLDRRDQPVPGAIVRWTVNEDGGAVGGASMPAVTDARGVAAVTRLLGPAAGVYRTTASVGERLGDAVHFTSITQVQGAMRMVRPPGDGDGQADTVLATLAPYRVTLLDHEDLPVAGATVSWVVSGGGSVSAATSTSDANGIAEVRHTLGTNAAAPQRVLAALPGLDGSPIEFNSTANPGKPVEIISLESEPRLATVRSEITHRVWASDAHGNAVSGVVIDWAVESGGGTIAPAQSVTMEHSGTDRPIALSTHTLSSDEGFYTASATATGLPGAPRTTVTAQAVARVVSLHPPDNLDCGWYYYYYGPCPSGFEPAEVTVAPGRTVAWLWAGAGHNVTFEDDPAEPISSRTQTTGSHLRTFDTPGTYRYRCTIHSSSFTEGMVGTVNVQ
jgi:hypothetical protein